MYTPGKAPLQVNPVVLASDTTWSQFQVYTQLCDPGCGIYSLAIGSHCGYRAFEANDEAWGMQVPSWWG